MIPAGRLRVVVRCTPGILILKQFTGNMPDIQLHHAHRNSVAFKFTIGIVILNQPTGNIPDIQFFYEDSYDYAEKMSQKIQNLDISTEDDTECL